MSVVILWSEFSHACGLYPTTDMIAAAG